MSVGEESLRLGIIGCGMMGRRHLEALSRLPDIKLMAFCDVLTERAEELAHRSGGTVYDNPERMLDEAALDAVYVVLPPFAHGLAERAAIERRIPMFIEKPIGADLSLCREIGAMVQEAHLLTSVGYHNRYRRTVRRAGDIFRSDRPVMACATWTSGLPLAPEQLTSRAWTLQRARTGGRFAETAGHSVDILRAFMGKVVAMSAFRAPPRAFNREACQEYDLDDVEVVMLQFASGAVATVSVTVAAQAGAGTTLSVFAGRHTAHFSGWEHNLHLVAVDGEGCRTDEDYPAEPPSWADWDHWRRTGSLSQVEAGASDDAFTIENRAFIKAVRKGDPGSICTTYADALETSEITLGIANCLGTGRKL